MRNKDVISYLGLWESIHNENFKGVEFDTFKNDAARTQMEILKNNKSFNNLKYIENNIRKEIEG